MDRNRENLPGGLNRENLPGGLNRENLPEGLNRESPPVGVNRETQFIGLNKENQASGMAREYRTSMGMNREQRGAGRGLTPAATATGPMMTSMGEGAADERIRYQGMQGNARPPALRRARSDAHLKINPQSRYLFTVPIAF